MLRIINRMKMFLSSLVLLSLPLLSSCTFFSVTNENEIFGNRPRLKAEGEQLTKVYPVGDFSSIDCGIVCDVRYTQSSAKVELNAPENIHEEVSLSVDEDGVLSVSFRNRWYTDSSLKGKICLTVSSEKLDSVSIRGAATFTAPQGIKGENFYMSVSGAGDVYIDGLEMAGDAKFGISGAAKMDVDELSCKNLKVNVSGAGDCEFSGRAEEGDVSVSGAGDVDLRELDVPGEFRTHSSGASRIRAPKWTDEAED